MKLADVLFRRLCIAGLASVSIISGANAADDIAAQSSPANHISVTFSAAAPAFAALFGETPRAETIAEGYQWAEGPLWIDEKDGFLLFTDVPGNTIYKWTSQNGATIFARPSGIIDKADVFREPGANGLATSATPGEILVANHGRRAVTQLNLSTRESVTLVAQFQGKRFNSPNDLIRAKDGAIYFTDPPYGLKGLDESSHKELATNGVYRLDPNGDIALLTDQFARPNGIALSPDEKTLYISNSDPQEPVIVAFSLNEGDIDASSARLLLDASAAVAKGALGLPDGMAVDATGRVFATAPGGVHVFSPSGDLLGVINTGFANANCAIGEAGKALFIAAHSQIIRIPFAAANEE